MVLRKSKKNVITSSLMRKEYQQISSLVPTFYSLIPSVKKADLFCESPTVIHRGKKHFSLTMKPTRSLCESICGCLLDRRSNSTTEKEAFDISVQQRSGIISLNTVGAVLHQVIKRLTVPIGFFYKKLSWTKTRYLWHLKFHGLFNTKAILIKKNCNDPI